MSCDDQSPFRHGEGWGGGPAKVIIPPFGNCAPAKPPSPPVEALNSNINLSKLADERVGSRSHSLRIICIHHHLVVCQDGGKQCYFCCCCFFCCDCCFFVVVIVIFVIFFFFAIVNVVIAAVVVVVAVIAVIFLLWLLLLWN